MSNSPGDGADVQGDDLCAEQYGGLTLLGVDKFGGGGSKLIIEGSVPAFDLDFAPAGLFCTQGKVYVVLRLTVCVCL